MTKFAALLRNCFPVHPIPSSILVYRHSPDCDSDEAAQLLGVEWTRVDNNFWRDHWSASSALCPSGFVYYLPSMLIASLDKDNGLIRSSLIYIFNTSGDPEMFSQFLLERIDLMNLAQIKCLIMWSNQMRILSYFDNNLEDDRVHLTLMLFEEALDR